MTNCRNLNTQLIEGFTTEKTEIKREIEGDIHSRGHTKEKARETWEKKKGH